MTLYYPDKIHLSHSVRKVRNIGCARNLKQKKREVFNDLLLDYRFRPTHMFQLKKIFPPGRMKKMNFPILPHTRRISKFFYRVFEQEVVIAESFSIDLSTDGKIESKLQDTFRGHLLRQLHE